MEQGYLREIMAYDYATGTLTWKNREDRSKSWNTRFSGKEALGSVSKNGYKVGDINDKSFYAHRVVWMYVFGMIPEGHDIDHINRDRCDNRIANLRLASRSSNNANRLGADGATSKYLGVSWSKRYNKWVAQITKNYKNKLLGRFCCEIEAAKAYDAAAIENHGEYARVNFPIRERVE